MHAEKQEPTVSIWNMFIVVKLSSDLHQLCYTASYNQVSSDC